MKLMAKVIRDTVWPTSLREEPDRRVKKYRVELTAEERHNLLQSTRRGKTAVRKLTRVRILLKAEEGLSNEEIAEEVAPGCRPSNARGGALSKRIWGP
jgi:hypothetical protein